MALVLELERGRWEDGRMEGWKERL
jgi:hypothetical protein